MNFRLIYQGQLFASGNDVGRQGPGRAAHKHQIRQELHPQIKELWQYPPLNQSFGKSEAPSYPQYLDPSHERGQMIRGQHKFVALVRSDLELTAELDIIFLRREFPGTAILQGGDLDNRLKTLLDALRLPKDRHEIPESFTPQPDECPLFCLLEDDCLVTSIKISAGLLLNSKVDKSDVHLVIHVSVRGPDREIINVGTWG